MRNISQRAAIVAVASMSLCLSRELALAGDRDPWSGTYLGVTGGSGYGAYLGNNQKLGNFVIGVEAEAKSGTGELTVQKSAIADINWTLSARARAGVLVFPSLFIYGVAGVGAIDSMLSTNGNWSRETMAGLQLGVGAEFKLLEQLSLRVDYIHTDPSSKLIGSLDSSHIPDPSLGVLQFGVTYRF